MVWQNDSPNELSDREREQSDFDGRCVRGLVFCGISVSLSLLIALLWLLSPHPDRVRITGPGTPPDASASPAVPVLPFRVADIGDAQIVIAEEGRLNPVCGMIDSTRGLWKAKRAMVYFEENAIEGKPFQPPPSDQWPRKSILPSFVGSEREVTVRPSAEFWIEFDESFFHRRIPFKVVMSVDYLRSHAAEVVIIRPGTTAPSPENPRSVWTQCKETSTDLSLTGHFFVMSKSEKKAIDEFQTAKLAYENGYLRIAQSYNSIVQQYNAARQAQRQHYLQWRSVSVPMMLGALLAVGVSALFTVKSRMIPFITAQVIVFCLLATLVGSTVSQSPAPIIELLPVTAAPVPILP